MAKKKTTPKDWFMMNFDRIALFGVIAIIVLSFIYMLFSPSPVREKRNQVRELIDKINKKKRNTPPVEEIETDYLAKVNKPFESISAAVKGPEWAMYRMPYVIKSWDIIQIQTIVHTAPTGLEIVDEHGSIRVTFEPGEWQGDLAKEHGEYVKFELYRKLGDESEWKLAKVFKPGDKYEYEDKDYRENTRYAYKVVSHAKLKEDTDTVRLNAEVVESEEASLKTQFSFLIMRINDQNQQSFREKKTFYITMRKQVTLDDGREVWAEWTKPYCVDPSDNALPHKKGITNELEYYDEMGRDVALVTTLYDKEGNRLSGQSAKIQVDKLDTGYDISQWNVNFDKTNPRKVDGYFLVLKHRGSGDTVNLNFDSSGKPVEEEKKDEKDDD